MLKSIDTLLVVADMSARSLETAATIIKVARGHGNVQVKKTGLTLNRIRSKEDPVKKIGQQTGMEILGTIPEDENINQFDRAGRPLLELPAESPGLAAVRRMLNRMNLL